MQSIDELLGPQFRDRKKDGRTSIDELLGRPDPSLSVQSALHVNPDEHARHKRLADKSGLPVEAITADRKQVEEAVRKREIDDLLRGSPSTARFMSDPDNAKLGHDAVEGMSRTEAILRGMVGRAANLLGGTADLLGVFEPLNEGVDALGDWLERMVPLGQVTIGPDGLGWRPSTEEDLARRDGFSAFARFMGEVDENVIDYRPVTSWEDVKKEPLANVLPFAFEQGLVSVPDMAAVLINLPAYVVARTGETGQERAANDGRGEATLEDFVLAAPSAVASAFLERLGARGMIGLDDVVKRLRDIPGAVGKAALKEGATEFGQEFVETAGETAGTEKGFDVAEGLERGLAGFVGGAPFGGGVRAVTGTVEGVVKSRRAARQQEFFRALGDSQAANKLRARMPENERERIRAIVGETGVDTIYVDGAVLGELYQSGGLDDAFELMDEGERTALRQELNAAQAHGGFVAVPLDTFASKIAGTPAFDQLVNDVKVHEDDFTANEAARFNDEVQDIYETELNEARKAAEVDAELADVVDRIGEMVREQSIRAGNAPDVATQHAALHRARARVIQSYGLDPMPFWQGLEIRRELPEALRSSRIDDLDLLIERARRGIGQVVRDDRGNETFSREPDHAELERRKQAEELVAELERRGIDLNEDNEAIKAALREPVTGEEALTQPVNVDVDPERQVDVLDLTALADDPKTSTKDLVDELRVWANEDIPTADLGRVARILPRNVRHVAFSGAPIRHEDRKTRNRSVRNIVDLLGHAVLIESGPNTKPGKQKIDSYHRFYVPVWDGRKARVVRVVMEQTKGGVKINPDAFDVYDVVLERKPPAAVGLSSGRASNPSPSKAAQGASSITIRQMLTGVKGMDGAEYFQPLLKTDGKVDADALYQGRKPDVELTGQEFEADGPALRQAAEKHYGSLIQGPGVNNPTLGLVKFSGGGRNKTLRGGPTKWRLVAGLEAIVKSARRVGDPVPPTDPGEARNVRAYHFMETTVRLGTDVLTVHFHVREDSNGKFQYDLFYKRKAPRQEAGRASEDGVSSSGELPQTSIAPDGDGINLIVLERADNQPRGSFIPARGDFGPIINLFEGADLSTFLHETGHFFVDTMEKVAAMPDAPEQAKADYQALLRFVGAERASDLDVRLNGDEARAKQEKLAEAFEKYLSEGNAPSVELQTAFAKFRAWLITVYREIKGRLMRGGMELEISDDLRRVFDRMLATDEEIDAAQQYAKFGVNEAIADLMTDAEREAYIKADQDARAFAVAEIESRKARERAREAKRWWKEQLGEIRREVEREYAARPVYIALDLLRDRSSGVKLSREAIVDLRGEEALGLLPKAIYVNKGGVHPDAIAEQVGMTSGDELLMALMNAPPNRKERNRLIMAETIARMKDRHGSIEDNTRHAAEAAMEAVHNDRRGLFIEAELKAVSRKAGGRPTPASVAKQAARRIIAGQAVKDATRVNRYYTAAVKFAREAQTALARQDFAAAAEAKRKQMLNHYLFIEARKVRDEVNRTAKYFRKFDGPAKRLRGIAPDYVERIQDLLSAYQFRLSLKRHDKMVRFRKWLEEQNNHEEIAAQVPEELLNVSERTHYRNLTVEELRGLKDTVRHLEVLGRNKRKLLANKEQRELDAVAEEIRASILENWTGEVKPPSASRTDRKKQLDSVLRRFSLRKIEFLLRELDGFREGPAKRYIFDTVAKATNDLSERRHKAARAMADLFSVYSGREAKAMFSKKVFIPEIGDSYTKSSILAVALNVGNADSRAKVLDTYGWTEDQLQAVLGRLDKRDWDFVQSVWDYIDTFWAETVELERATKGYAPPKVEAIPVETPFGTYRGGYYPLKYDERQNDTPVRHTAEDMMKAMVRGELGRPMTRQGRTIARVGKVTNMKVKFDLDVLFEHVEETVHDLAMRKAALDVSRLLNHPAVSEALRNTVGPNRLAQLRDWLRDSIAGDLARGPVDGLERAAEFIRQRTVFMTLGLKISTIILQPLGYTQTMARFISETGSVTGGMRYAGKAVFEVLESPKENAAFVYERSSMMRERARTFDRDIYNAVKQIKDHKRSVYEAFLMAGIGKAQKLVDLPTWLAAYNFALDRHAGDEAAAIDYADSVVRMTQGSGLASDLAAIQRGSAWQKLVTMFMTFFNAMHNMVVDEVKMTKAQGLKRAHIFATNMLLLTFIPANLFPEIFAAAGVGGPDDDESWAWWMFKNWLTFGVGGIPILRDWIGAVLNDYPYQISPIQGAAKSAVDLYKQVEQLVEDGEVDKPLFKAALKTAAVFGPVKLPANQIILTTEYAWDVHTGEKDPDNAVEAVIEAFVQKDHRDR